MQESGWAQGGAGDYRSRSGTCMQGSFSALYAQNITEPDGLRPTNAKRMLWGCIRTHFAGYDWFDSASIHTLRGFSNICTIAVGLEGRQ
jgi:hypothetical protein